MDIEEFNLGVGSKVGVVLKSGELVTGTIATYDHDKLTGEVRMTLADD